MEPILSLPRCLFSSILLHWLDVIALAKLDSAFTSKILRFYFLKTITNGLTRSPSCAFEHVLSFIEWSVERRLKLVSLVLDTVTQNLIKTLSVIDLSKVTALTITAHRNVNTKYISFDCEWSSIFGDFFDALRLFSCVRELIVIDHDVLTSFYFNLGMEQRFLLGLHSVRYILVETKSTVNRINFLTCKVFGQFVTKCLNAQCFELTCRLDGFPNELLTPMIKETAIKIVADACAARTNSAFTVSKDGSKVTKINVTMNGDICF